jgi:hypothetical protein
MESEIFSETLSAKSNSMKRCHIIYCLSFGAFIVRVEINNLPQYLIKHHAIETYWELEVLALHSLRIGNGELHVSAALCSEKKPQHSLHSRVGGSQNRSRQSGGKRKHLPPTGIELQPSSSQPVAIPTELSRLPNPCGGGVEYLHREPASRKRRRNGTKKGRAIA